MDLVKKTDLMTMIYIKRPAIIAIFSCYPHEVSLDRLCSLPTLIGETTCESAAFVVASLFPSTAWRESVECSIPYRDFPVRVPDAAPSEGLSSAKLGKKVIVLVPELPLESFFFGASLTVGPISVDLCGSGFLLNNFHQLVAPLDDDML